VPDRIDVIARAIEEVGGPRVVGPLISDILESFFSTLKAVGRIDRDRYEELVSELRRMGEESLANKITSAGLALKVVTLITTLDIPDELKTEALSAIFSEVRAMAERVGSMPPQEVIEELKRYPGIDLEVVLLGARNTAYTRAIKRALEAVGKYIRGERGGGAPG